MENNQGFITTVSVYSYDRDYINHLSEEIGLSQKRIVAMLVEAHKSLKLAPADPPNKEQFDKIMIKDETFYMAAYDIGVNYNYVIPEPEPPD